MTALVYVKNTVDELPHDALHIRLPNKPTVWADRPFRADEEVRFSLSPDRCRQFGTMHLASASLRLLWATFLVHRRLLKAGAVSPFTGLERNDYWQHTGSGGLYEHAEKALRWRCCRFQHMRKNDIWMRRALGVLAVHRDAIAHGRHPTGAGYALRGRLYRRLYRCRIIEVQLRLADWVFEENLP